MKTMQAVSSSRILALVASIAVWCGSRASAQSDLLAGSTPATASYRATFESAGPLIETYCFGTPSACPCGNATGGSEGCMNSFGFGGKLVGTGNARISNDTISLTVSHLPTTAATVLFQGTVQSNAGSGVVFGDGLRCADTSVWRLVARNAAAGGFSFGFGSGTPKVSVKGHLPIQGATRFYQAWYRNSATFCTADSVNLTNGLKIVWAP